MAARPPTPRGPAKNHASVRCACIDIGSNTTRLLVAECRGAGAIRELMTQRVYTRLGKSLGRDKVVPRAKVDELAEVVERQVRHARELGALRVRMALHTGEADLRAGDYYGTATPRTARQTPSGR